MKNSLAILSLILLPNYIFCQNLIHHKEYFTYPNYGKISHTWTAYADGTKNGTELYYYSNGKIQWNALWDKDVIKKVTAFFEDGSLMYSGNYFDGSVLEGEQKVYEMQNGVRYLKYNARTSKKLHQDDKQSYYYTFVDFMEYYSNPKTRLFKYTNVNNKQEYIEGTGADEKKFTIVNGELVSAKSSDAEISNGRFIKISKGSKSKNIIVGDTIYFYQAENEQDSTVYSVVRDWKMNIDLYTDLSINPHNIYFSFKLFNEIEGVKLPYRKDVVTVVNYNEMESNFSVVLENAFDYFYVKKGWFRKYSRKTGKLLYESYTNKQSVKDIENTFFENGMLKESRNGKNVVKYSKSGTVLEKITNDTILKYFENGLLALESTENYCKTYFPSGKLKKLETRETKKVKDYDHYGNVNDLNIIIPKSYQIFDSLGTIVYQGEIKTTIAEKTKYYEDYSKNIDQSYKKVQNNLSEFNKNKKIYSDLENKTVDFSEVEYISKAFDKYYGELWSQIQTEQNSLSIELKPFENLNWDLNYYYSVNLNRVGYEIDQVNKDIYLNLCLNFNQRLATILGQMNELEKKFVKILNSQDRFKINKALRKETSDKEIKAILGI